MTLVGDIDLWPAAHEVASANPRVKLRQTAVLHDLFGNTLRDSRVNPALLAWNEGTVHRIAQAIYDDRAFDRLPILADSLEDAGCDDADLLAHCRGAGPHVRGCWAVDLLLGKE
jgi:hypothetical protein